MKYKIIIPARYNSTRLPGKPLKKIGGIPLVIKTAMNCTNVFDKSLIVICTDDERIRHECEKYSFKWSMTSAKCLTGMDRVSEFALKDDASYYVNVQGDEPFIDPVDIDNLANLARTKMSNMTTLFSSLHHEDFSDDNVVKLWLDSEGKVENFSRRVNDENTINAKKHIGLYCYKAKFLREFVKWKQTSNEIERSLEQMRAMDNGEEIYAIESVGKYHLGVDTESDLNKAVEISKNFK